MRFKSEKGSATILAFGLTIMILALAIGFLMSALVEKKASYNYMDSVSARMAAQTAMERAVASVRISEAQPVSYEELYSKSSAHLNDEEKKELVSYLQTSYGGTSYISQPEAERLVNEGDFNWIYNSSNDAKPKYISRMAYAVVGAPTYSKDTPRYPDAFYLHPVNETPKITDYKKYLYQRFNLARADWNSLTVDDFMVNDTPWSKDAPASQTIKYLREFNDGSGTFPDIETRRKQIIANLIDYSDSNNIPTGDSNIDPTYLGLESVPFINRVIFEITGTIIYESGGGTEDPEDPEDPYEYGDMPWWWPQPTNPSYWPCQNWPWPPNGKPSWWPASWTWPPDKNANPAPWGWWTPWANTWYVWDWKTGPFPGTIESGFSPPEKYLFQRIAPNWWPPEWPWPPIYRPTPPSWWPASWTWPPVNGWFYDKSLSIYNSAPPPWTPPNLPTNPWPWPDGPNSSNWPPPSPQARPSWWPTTFWPWPPPEKPSWWDSQDNWFWPPGEWKSWLTPLPPWLEGEAKYEWYWETGPVGYFYLVRKFWWWPDVWPWPPPYPGEPFWWSEQGWSWPPQEAAPWGNQTPWKGGEQPWYWETGPTDEVYSKNPPNWWSEAGNSPSSRVHSWPWPPPYPGKPSWWPGYGNWPPANNNNPWSSKDGVPDCSWSIGPGGDGSDDESYYHFSASITPKIQAVNIYNAHTGVIVRLDFDVNISYAINDGETGATDYPDDGDPTYIQKNTPAFSGKAYTGIAFDEIILNTEVTSEEKTSVNITVTLSNLKVRLFDSDGNLLDYSNICSSKVFTFNNVPLNQDEFKFYLSFETADPRQNHNLGDWTQTGSCLEAEKLSFNPDFSAYFDDLSNASNHNKAYLTARASFGATSNTDTERKDIAPWQISTVNYELGGDDYSGIKNAPMGDIFELGLIHRADSFRTLNLKKFNDGTDFAYEKGDAGILDHVKIGSDAQREIAANLNSRDRARLAELFHLEVDSDTGRGVTDALLASLPPGLYKSRAEVMTDEASDYLTQNMIAEQTKGDIYMEIMTGALNDAEALPFERFYVIAIGQGIRDVEGFKDSKHGQYDHGVDKITSTQKIIAEVIREPGIQNRYKIVRIRYLDEE